MDLDDRVRLLLDAPLGSAFFAKAALNGLDVDDLVRPEVSAYVAAWGQDDLDSGVSALDEALRAGARYRDFARRLVYDERVAWWWADLEREHQFWVSDSKLVAGTPFDLADGPHDPGHWYDHAQHPDYDTCTVTSTEFSATGASSIRTGQHTELAKIVHTDWIAEYPARQARVAVRADARVFEIHEPAAWYELARRYGDLTGYARAGSAAAGQHDVESGPGPVWPRAAADWDGVHLSLFGLLTSLFVPTFFNGLTATLMWWHTERTLWLRDAFAAVEPLPALTSRPRPTDRLRRVG